MISGIDSRKHHNDVSGRAAPANGKDVQGSFPSFPGLDRPCFLTAPLLFSACQEQKRKKRGLSRGFLYEKQVRMKLKLYDLDTSSFPE
jgi:hypothetical protein